MTKLKIYKLQDHVLETIYNHFTLSFQDAEFVLAGGTALSRFYLKHRISYDLDFFLSKSFDPSLLLHKFKQLGMPIEVIVIESGPTFAAQLHGIMKPKKNESIKVSFVEDVFAGMFDTVSIDGIKTEVIDGLFHRKLRTVSGTGTATSQAGHELGIGNRQTARDLFDLYILDTVQEPIDSFISRINQKGAMFPSDLFKQNLAAIPWMDLIDEAELLEVIPPTPPTNAMLLKRHFDDVLKRLL